MKLTLKPSGETVEIDEGKDLLSSLTEKGIYIKSSCGGNASCSDCVIKVVSGEDNLESPTFEEIKYLGNVFHITKERMACQTKICGDVTIDVSGHDKDRDSETLKNKTSSKFSKRTKVRKKEEVAKKVLESRSEEKEPPLKEGGNRRPKPFNYSNDDDGES